jgi:hypothetical protein
VVGGAGLRARVDEAAEQGAQVLPLDRLDERVEVGGHLLVGDGRRLREVAQLVLVLGCDAHPLDGHGRAVALVDGVAAEHAHHGSGRADRSERLDLVPDDGLDGAGHVAQLELQERLAGAALAPRVSAHDEYLVDLLAVRQVAHEAPRGGQGRLLHRDCQGKALLGRFPPSLPSPPNPPG